MNTKYKIQNTNNKSGETNMFLVYLAGPITGLDHGECTDWRQTVIDTLPEGIEGLSPMRAKSYLKNTGRIVDTYEDWVMCTQRGIYARDKFDCGRADAVLVNMLGAKIVSIGTVMEIAWATAYNTQIVLVMEKEGNIHEHALLREACPFRVESIEEGVDVLGALLLPLNH